MKPVTLYQFEISHFSEKVRFLLDYKSIPFIRKDVNYGAGQKVVQRLTGQRQVPVIVDPNNGDRVIHDSTAIAFYLEEQYPDPPIIPKDPLRRADTLLLEDWLDTALGVVARKLFIWRMKGDNDFVRKTMEMNADDLTKKLFPIMSPLLMAILMKRDGINDRTVAEARGVTDRALDALETRLEAAPYLTGETPTLADFTAAGTAMLLQLPPHGYLRFPADLAHEGVPEVQAAHKRFFEWKDRMYEKFRKKPGDA
ncbi:MAG: glutathione S-transferase family protein [Myxococcota bacterium]